MLSFIIIGRNEGWKLTKCFESVIKTIEVNNLTDSEVIYVDSKSTDDSITRAKKFPKVKIFQITGHCNAAIGRNIGAKEAKGDVFFFIDGDMEIKSSFLPLVYNEKSGLRCQLVSGQVKNYNYDKEDNLLGTSYQFKKLIKEKYFTTSGGIFLIKKRLWDENNGMDINFELGEDHDFVLRLTKQGYPLLRKPEIIANHYTISYTHSSRVWKTLFSGNIFYSKSLLYRKHVLNKYIFIKMLREDYSLLILLFSSILSIMFHIYYPLVLYLLIVLLRVIKSKNKLKTRLRLLIYFPIRDITTFFGIFFFFTCTNIKIKYKEL